MLTQINHWMEYASTGIDVVLLLRVLGLRLQRKYVFITLACVLTVIFDVAELRYGQETMRVQLYSDLLMAFVFPVAVWDIFEEIATSVAALRRTAMLRTMASLIIIFFFGLLYATSLSHVDDPSGLLPTLSLALIVSTGSATGCLAFLWIMRRGLRQMKTPTPKNTSVWMIFFALALVEELASWFVLMADDTLSASVRDQFSAIAILVLNCYGIAITVWCTVKLRGLPKDLQSASVHENS